MTVTKDQLELLEAQRPKRNTYLEYTIGGTTQHQVHAHVHESQEAWRQGLLHKGHRILKTAQVNFENNMAVKSRKGQARADFSVANDVVPPGDEKTALNTWNENAIAAHKERLSRASNNLRQQLDMAVRGQPPIVDTDLGYGNGTPDPVAERFSSQKHEIRNKKVQAFLEEMKQPRELTYDRER